VGMSRRSPFGLSPTLEVGVHFSCCSEFSFPCFFVVCHVPSFTRKAARPVPHSPLGGAAGLEDEGDGEDARAKAAGMW